MITVRTGSRPELIGMSTSCVADMWGCRGTSIHKDIPQAPRIPYLLVHIAATTLHLRPEPETLDRLQDCATCRRVSGFCNIHAQACGACARGPQALAFDSARSGSKDAANQGQLWPKKTGSALQAASRAAHGAQGVQWMCWGFEQKDRHIRCTAPVTTSSSELHALVST